MTKLEKRVSLKEKKIISKLLINRVRKEKFCWFCNKTVRYCEHNSREQKRTNKFLNWINYGGKSNTSEKQVIDNHYTDYGRGYRDAISHVYFELTKTFKIKGLMND